MYGTRSRSHGFVLLVTNEVPSGEGGKGSQVGRGAKAENRPGCAPSSELERPPNRETLKASTPASLYRLEVVGKNTCTERRERICSKIRWGTG